MAKIKIKYTYVTNYIKGKVKIVCNYIFEAYVEDSHLMNMSIQTFDKVLSFKAVRKEKEKGNLQFEKKKVIFLSR